MPYDVGGGGGKAGQDTTDAYALSKPYELNWPPTPEQWQNLNEMLVILFGDSTRHKTATDSAAAPDLSSLEADIAALETDVSTLESEVNAIQSSVGGSWDASVIAAADESSADSTTLTDDTELQLSLEASETYFFECEIWCRYDADSDFKCRLDVTSAVSAVILNNHIIEQSGAASTLDGDTGIIAFPSATQTLASTTNNSLGIYRCRGFIKTSAATIIKFQFAKNSAPGTNEATRLAGSFMQARLVT